MNKKLSKIKPHTMIFDHQICKHVSKKFATIIKDEFLCDKDEFLCVGVRNNDEYGGWPLWKSSDWLGFLDQYIDEFHPFDKKIHQEYIDLKNYLDGTEIKYIVSGD
jgi:hypothetical protein